MCVGEGATCRGQISSHLVKSAFQLVPRSNQQLPLFTNFLQKNEKRTRDGEKWNNHRKDSLILLSCRNT